MAFLRLASALLLLHQISLVFTTNPVVNCYGLSPAPSPVPKPPATVLLPPIKPPTMPPTMAPTKPPTMAPTKPPTMAPAKPPMAPAKPPTMAPAKPPMQPPVKPPVPRGKSVAVLGAVFCESVCKYMGDYNKITRVSPLEGAVVKLACNNSLVEQATTERNGYFLMTPPNVTADGVDKCRVFLVKSPNPRCSVATKLNDGSTGATLTPTVKSPYKERLLAYSLFNVGPFSFQPAKIRPCRYY